MYRCHKCGKEFTVPKTYNENHGLDLPPYEPVPICPHCSSTEFAKWELNIEKSEVARTLVNIVAALNRLQNNIADVFGNNFKNEDLEYAQEISAEFVEEMYDEFIPPAVSNAIRQATSTFEVDRIMLRLEG